MAQYGIQKVLKLRGYDITTDEPKIFLKFLKDLTLANGQESVALTQNGTPLTHFDHSQSLTLEGSSSTIDEGLMALQFGKDLEILIDSTEVRISEVLTVDSDATATTATATGTVGEELKFIEVLDANGTQVSILTQAVLLIAGTFTVTGKNIAFFASEIADNTKVRVHYYPTIASVRKLQKLGTNGSATLRWECEAVFKDVCSSEEVLGLILIPKGHLLGAFSWALSEGGDPAVHDFSLVAEKTCDDEELWTNYIFSASDIS